MFTLRYLIELYSTWNKKIFQMGQVDKLSNIHSNLPISYYCIIIWIPFLYYCHKFMFKFINSIYFEYFWFTLILLASVNWIYNSIIFCNLWKRASIYNLITKKLTPSNVSFNKYSSLNIDIGRTCWWSVSG